MQRYAAIVDRVRANVRRLMEQPNRTPVRQKAIAKALGLSTGQISNFLKGKYGLALKHLDPLAECLGVPTSELVRQDGQLYELTLEEMRLIEYVREWTPEVRAGFIGVFDFLHGRLPSDPQTLRMFDYWRRLELPARDLVFASAVRLHEEDLPPDVRAGLAIQEAGDGTTGRLGRRRRGGEP